MPGASRSGTTITGGLFAGLTRPVAARFSFVLALPAITGAGLKELYGEYKKLKAPEGSHGLFASGDELTALLVGTFVAGVVGYFSIAWLLHFLKRYNTAVFIIYRLLLGVALLSLIGLGIMK
jgi:undecaprenyl-diphosphatase